MSATVLTTASPRPCPLKSPWATSWPKPLPCRPRPSSPCRKTSALIIGTTPIHGGLLVFIKHAVSPDIPDDKNDLLREAPYAQFVPDLNQFSRLYEATFRYDLHNHLASLYLTIPYQT